MEINRNPQRRKPRLVAPQKAAPGFIRPTHKITGGQARESQPALSRERIIAGELPEWSPLPPHGPTITRRL